MIQAWRNRVALTVGVTAAVVATTFTPAPTAATPAGPAGASAAAASSPSPPSACTTSGSPPGGLVPFEPGAPYSGPPLLLPAWADSAGWLNPQQYETIVDGDIDGDGLGELVGRNSSGIETHSWAHPFRLPGDPSAPTTVDQPPGQWTQLPHSSLPFGERSTAAVIPSSYGGNVPGYFDLSYASTFRLADIDGNPGEELIVRQPQLTPGNSASNNLPYYQGDIMAVYRFANGSWNPTPIPGPSWNNWGTDTPSWGNHPTGWFNPQYYTTITTGNVDGQGGDEIIGRGPNGIEAWTLNAAGTGFELLPANNAILTDAEGWGASEAQYSSIRVADFTGDGRDDIAALATDQNPYPTQGAGMLLYTYTGSGWGWSGTVTSWIPENGWDKPEQYGSITAGDIDGDNQAEIIGRGPNGLEAYHSEIDQTSGQRVWTAMITTPTVMAGSTYAQPEYYSTVQTGDVLLSTGQYPTDEVLYRGTDGLHTLSYDSTAKAFTDLGVVLDEFSDTNGWNASPARYSTIRTVMTDAGQPRAVIGKDAAGVRTYVLDPAARPTQWINPSTPFPAWSGGTDDTSLGDGTDPGRSYQYINASVTNALYGDFAPPQSVRSMFHELGTDMSLVASEIPKTKPMSLNVPRNTYQAVEQDVTDWTNAVNYLRSYYFSDSGSLQQLLETTLLIASNNSYSVDSIANVFSNSGDKFLAMMMDLITGIIGAAGFIFTGPDAATWVPFLFATLTMVGAGAQAGLEFSNLNGSITTEKDTLDNAIVNTFCQADAFLFGTHEQIVDDYGLLTAMAEMYGSGVIRFTDENYAQLQQLANTGRAVWVYQQFAGSHSHGWTAGRCWQTACNLNNTSGYAKSYSGAYQYAMITTDGDGTGNCLHASSDSYSTLVNDLGVNPQDWTSPTKMFWSNGDDFQSTFGEPIWFSYDGKQSQGLLGWHIKTEDCHDESTP